jgi:hypothetical protein
MMRSALKMPYELGDENYRRCIPEVVAHTCAEKSRELDGWDAAGGFGSSLAALIDQRFADSPPRIAGK